MPEYVYRCTNCQHTFEIEQRITAEPLSHCPNCNLDKLQRIIGNVGISFNAGGFYSTDKKDNAKEKSTSAADKVCSKTNQPCSSGQCPAAK